MTAAEWNALIEKWTPCRNVLGTDGYDEIMRALHEGRRLNRTQGEVARRAPQGVVDRKHLEAELRSQSDEIDRLRALFKLDGDQHAEHIKRLNEQNQTRLDAYNREVERLREWQRRAMVVIECPSSDTIQDEIQWLREASKP